MNNATKNLGIQGEVLVAEWLQKKGITILARNYRTRRGEVDLIASKNETIAFVEVKTRRNKYFTLSNNVTLRKQDKIIRAAKDFILTNKISDKVLRFDIATVLYDESSHSIEYIPNAFQEQRCSY